jgi:predicted regulator of amino acid metabolism with ACT domain
MGLSIFDSRLATKYYREAINESKMEGLLNAIQTTLAVRFGSESLALMTIIKKIDKNEALQSLFEQILKANTIEEVKRFLQ